MSANAAYHEMTLFDDADPTEYEANVFAAELLDFKFRILKKRGYKVESPVVSNGNFLKDLEQHADKISLD